MVGPFFDKLFGRKPAGTPPTPPPVPKTAPVAAEPVQKDLPPTIKAWDSYGRIMEVMGTIIQGGFTKVSLLTEQPGGKPAAGPVPVPATSGSAVSPPALAPAPTSSAAPRRQGRG